MVRLRRAPVWWRLPGVIAAYQFVVAPSYVHMLANVAPGGRYTLTSAAYPTWAPHTGATFNGSTQYMATSITAQDDKWSMLVRISGAPTTGLAAVMGYRDAASTKLQLWSSFFGTVGYENNQDTSQSPGLAAGVIGVAAQRGYRNGVLDVTGGAPYSTGPGTNTIYLGCCNNNGTPTWFAACSIQAALVCSRTMSAAEMSLASHQMAYCEYNPAWNAWAPARRYFVMAPAAAGGAAKMNTYYRRMRS